MTFSFFIYASGALLAVGIFFAVVALGHKLFVADQVVVPNLGKFRIRDIPGYGFSPEVWHHKMREWHTVCKTGTDGVRAISATKFAMTYLCKTEQEAGERINNYCAVQGAPVIWKETS